MCLFHRVRAKRLKALTEAWTVKLWTTFGAELKIRNKLQRVLIKKHLNILKWKVSTHSKTWFLLSRFLSFLSSRRFQPESFTFNQFEANVRCHSKDFRKLKGKAEGCFSNILHTWHSTRALFLIILHLNITNHFQSGITRFESGKTQVSKIQMFLWICKTLSGFDPV